MHILLIILVVATLLILLSRDYSLFQVEVKNGKIINVKGNLPARMKSDFEQTVTDISEGKIIGNKSNQGIKLSFKGNIGEFAQQRLRNVVGLYQR